MKNRLSVAAINHLLVANPAVQAELAEHAGQSATLALGPLALHVVVNVDGLLLRAESPTDASLTLSPWVLPRLAMGDETVWREAQLAGNQEFGAAFARVLLALRWDAERDLARVVGDVAAHRLGRGARALGHPKDAADRLALALGEFLREEAQAVATPHELAAFGADVHAVRDDTERLLKRLANLEQRATAIPS